VNFLREREKASGRRVTSKTKEITEMTQIFDAKRRMKLLLEYCNFINTEPVIKISSTYTATIVMCEVEGLRKRE